MNSWLVVLQWPLPSAYGNNLFDPQWGNISLSGWVGPKQQKRNERLDYQEVDCHDIDTENSRKVSKMEKKT